MNEENEKNKVGRPYKMDNWLIALNEVLKDEIASILTDRDLLALVNNKLSDEDKITRRTLSNWKAGKYHPNDELGQDFITSIDFATATQKLSILKKIMSGESKTWQNLAWILERRFPEEYSLRNYNINQNEEAKVIQITANNPEQQSLLESIINADFQEVKPIKIPLKNEVEPQNNDVNELPF